jgi:hypothetical protein
MIGLLSILIGLLARRDAPAILFGILCLFFVGYISYPLTGTLFNGFRAQYIIENVSFCAMLCVAMLIAMRISTLSRKWGVPFVSFGALMGVLSLIIHMLLPLGNLRMMTTYSQLISAYQWIVTAFIATAIYFAIKKGSKHVSPLLYGIVVFACALAMDRILPLHEPIFGGWFIEIASFVLVLSIGIVTASEVASKYRESAVMSERANSMERLYKSQNTHFQTLKQEMAQTKTMRHDMRHHLMIMDEYLRLQQYDKLDEFMREYRATVKDGELPDYCPIDVINILTYHYDTLAKQNGIVLDIRCDLKAADDLGYVNMSDADFCSLYSNLMENAVEACLRIKNGKKVIRVTIVRIDEDTLYIRVRNSASTVRQSDGQFHSSKQEDRIGYGLSSIRAIAEKYGGKAEFYWHQEQSEFESKVTVIS